MNRRPLVLDKAACYAIAQVIRDNHFFLEPNRERKGDEQPFGLLLRNKVNDAIIRLLDEDALKLVEVEVADEELWLIDRHLPLSAYDGAQLLLEQCWRILLESRLGMRTLTVPEVKGRNIAQTIDERKTPVKEIS